MSVREWWLCGALVTLAFSFACAEHQKSPRQTPTNSLGMDFFLMVLVSLAWPALWLVFGGIVIRTYLLRTGRQK